MKTTLFAVALSLLLLVALRAEAGPFSGLVVFGDSHSDVGNWPAVHGVSLPPEYYKQSRFSNGPVWVEILAEELDLPALRPSGAGGSDYAWGSTTGKGFDQEGSFDFPRVGTQVEQYLSNHQPKSDELFVVFAGHNDFGWGMENQAAAPVANLSAHIRALAAAGAQHFLVPNLQPIGHSPGYRGSDREPQLNQLTSEFNGLLSDELSKLEGDLAIHVYPVDFHGLVSQLITDPSAFGLANVTAQAFTDRGVVQNPETYLYWDDAHFTAVPYELLGKQAALSVPEPSGTLLAALAASALACSACRRRRRHADVATQKSSVHSRAE